MSRGTLELVKQTVQVIRENGVAERFVLEEERDDGAILLRPDTPFEAISERAPGRPMTREEFDQLIAPHVLPPDREG
jgi:nicotinamide riboside kinase